MTAQEIAILFDTYYEPIYRYVYFKVGHQQITEDIVSHIFEKAVRSFDSYLHGSYASPDPWIYTIARNTVIDHYRGKDAHNHTDIDDLPLASNESLEEQVDMHLTTEVLLSLFDAVSDRQREIIILRYQSELTNIEIAQLLDITEKSVSSQLAKGLKALRAAAITMQQSYEHI